MTAGLCTRMITIKSAKGKISNGQAERGLVQAANHNYSRDTQGVYIGVPEYNSSVGLEACTEVRLKK